MVASGQSPPDPVRRDLTKAIKFDEVILVSASGEVVFASGAGLDWDGYSHPEN